MKVGNIERNIKSVTQRPEVSNYCWRNRTDRLAQCRVATNPQFVKKKKKKKRKKRKKNEAISAKCNNV